MNSKVVLFALLVLMVGTVRFANAQSEQDKIAAAEMQKALDRQRGITLQFDSAVLLSHQGKYAIADKKFIFVLKTMRSIPTDLTYHFGVNSYYLGKYKQAIDWLNKYLQLKGTSGQYSEKTSEYLEKSQEALLVQQEAEREKAGIIASNDFDIDCGPSGKVTCPVCNGTTVIVKKGYFTETYKTCPFCNKKGYLSCEDYNKIVKGQLKPQTN